MIVIGLSPPQSSPQEIPPRNAPETGADPFGGLRRDLSPVRFLLRLGQGSTEAPSESRFQKGTTGANTHEVTANFMSRFGEPPISMPSLSLFRRPYRENPIHFLFLRFLLCLNSAGLLTAAGDERGGGALQFKVSLSRESCYYNIV